MYGLFYIKGQENGPNKVTFKQGSEGNKDISERKLEIKTGETPKARIPVEVPLSWGWTEGNKKESGLDESRAE